MTAFALVALVNIWILCSHPLSDAPTANLDTGEVYHAVQALRTDKGGPKVIFMGSSLVLASMMQAEANFLKRPIPRMIHRRNVFTEQQLGDLPGHPRVYCLAIGGEMASDNYLLLKNVLVGKHTPQALVLGVGPRDFQDNILPGVPATETFRALGTIFDGAQYLLDKRRLSSKEAFDVVLARLSPLYNYHADIRDYLMLRNKKMLQAALPWVMFYRYDQNGVLRPSRKGQLPEEVKGTPVVKPDVDMPHLSVKATADNYRFRYDPINREQVEQQFDYFERFLHLCNQRRINVLVVNMPLSRGNIALVPKGFYAYYKSRVSQACNAYDVELVDMCDQPYTKDEAFADGVHLSTGNSQPFLRSLCRRLYESRLASSFNSNL